MKKIVTALIISGLIFSSTVAFAGGLSTGLLGSYAIDGGAVEDTAKSAAIKIDTGNIYSDFLKKDDPIDIAGAVFFIRYDFSNNLFLRTGFEVNFTISKGHIEFDSGSDQIEFIIDYKSYAVPLYLGITLSPDKGRTNIYAATGIFYSMVEIERKFIDTDNGIYNFFKADSNSYFLGIGGLLGLERQIIKNTFLVMEYAFYSRTISEDESQYNSFYAVTYYYKERYSLPSHQFRIGAKYNF